jgi:DNA-binding transcriptional regulator YdaS (Cro superfamily)
LSLLNATETGLCSVAMILETYLQKKKLNYSEFARLIDVPPSYVSMLCKASFWPGRQIMLRILRATEGKVTPNDLLGVDVASFKKIAQGKKDNATDGESRRRRQRRGPSPS